MERKYYQEIIEDCCKIIPGLDDAAMVRIADKIASANNVFVVALGRSRLNMMNFAERLRELKIRAFVVGDISTPSIHKGDLLLITSSSGETSSLVTFANKAVSYGVEYVLFTMSPQSTLAKGASEVFVVHYQKPEELTLGMGSYSEWCIYLVFEAMIVYLARKMGKSLEELSEEACNLY